MESLTLKQIIDEGCFEEVISYLNRKKKEIIKHDLLNKSLKDIVKLNRCEDALSLLDEYVDHEPKSLSKSGHIIKHRQEANDNFTTPFLLAKFHIHLIKKYQTNYRRCMWYDPFRGSGNYYNQFPCKKKRKYWTEIKKDKDFFDFNQQIDNLIICSNPPYSKIWNVLVKSIELKPLIISYLVASHNLTPKRIELLENSGYGLVHLHIIKVRGWYGMSNIVIFKRGEKSKNITYDRIVWRQG